MTQQKKKSVITLIATAVLLIVAYLPRETDLGFKTMLGTSLLVMTRSLIHITLLSMWCVSVSRRVVNKKIRNLTVATGIFMALWILSKTIKWEFFPTNEDTAVRYLWYFFYVPMILIPVFGLFIIMYIDKPDNYKPPKKAYLICIPAAILLLAVFTNDLHNLVFTFPNGIELFNSDYGYGILYWFCLGWFIVLGLIFVIMLIKKSRFPGSKSIKKLPLYIMIGAIAFWLLYTFKVINGDLTVIDCLIITALLESAIQTGLIPTNSNYRELFEKTTVPVIVVDKDYQARYVSGSALPVSEENMRNTVNGSITLDNTLLSSAPIMAGRVVWQDDITALNLQRQELSDICESLSEESELIKVETEIKEKQAQADEKNRLYDKIAYDVSSQLEK
ncbi:MAG: hypothetical protein J6Q67_02115, partial [Clostridia bacterium]|nr:hypothetical protein [Clostridia bacterium]